MAEPEPSDSEHSEQQPFSKVRVTFAYKLLRGAKPPAGEVERLMEKCTTIDQLRRHLVTDAGGKLHGIFQEGIQQRFLKAPRPEIEVDVAKPVLERLLASVESVWRGFGESDPFWSVLTKFKPAGATVDRESFYATGRKRIEFLAAALARNGVDIKSLPVCFELGAGVGRLTVWLAEHFQRVIAADISSAHLEVAAHELAARGKSNVAFLRIATMAELENAPPFDVFFSIISLQHSPPPVIKHVLTTLLGKLNPGGVAYFQLPTLIPEQRFAAETYAPPAARQAPQEQMETFAVPQKVMFAIFDELGLKLLEIREDNQCGPHKLSNTFLVQRPK